MMWRCSQFSFDTKMPTLMGILNVTPDSFSDGGLYATVDDALAHARRMVQEGAAIIRAPSPYLPKKSSRASSMWCARLPARACA